MSATQSVGRTQRTRSSIVHQWIRYFGATFMLKIGQLHRFTNLEKSFGSGGPHQLVASEAVNRWQPNRDEVFMISDTATGSHLRYYRNMLSVTMIPFLQGLRAASGFGGTTVAAR
jgi:hypothetical protein